MKRKHRNNLGLATAIMLVALLQACSTDSRNYSQLVNPFIGTDFTGNTYPGAQYPHGMVQLSPDNGLPGWDRIAGYFYPDSTIAGFSHTHLSGTGAGDLYDISFMPYSEPARVAEAPLGLHSRFSHSDETARAGYYSVMLADYGIKVELTATEHCGVQRYTWQTDEGKVMLNLAKATNWDRTVSSHIERIDSVTIAGYRFSDGWARNQKVWFATRFSKPFKAIEIDTVGSGNIATFTFGTARGEQLTVSTALSGVDIEGALRNLNSEVPDNDFDKYLAQTTAEWNRRLGKIEITTDDSDAETVFYTALYHSMLAPVVFSDVDGRYRGPDGNIHQCRPGHKHYSTFSLWDTYRAAHPLYTIIEPREAGDMAESLLEFSRQNNQLPVWNMWASETDMMIGYHSAPVIADAVLKGIADLDAREALMECVKTARLDSYRSIGDYRRLGFVPCDKDSSWSMSKTLEYAFDDYCIALLAEHAGIDSIRNEFATRAASYRNTFNPETRFFQPRRSDGSFLPDFSPEHYTEDICESNAWQYLWSVQHDVDGLAELLGGKNEMEARLDEFFTVESDSASLPIFSTGMIGQYAHGNEPSHHVAYLYNYCNKPHKAQSLIARIMRSQYANTPSGLCGNEDCGQMSAWAVFSALGFYPLNPVSGEYSIGTPMFKNAIVHLDNGATFTISAPKASAKNIFVEKMNLNGSPIDRTNIKHSEITNGGKLEFIMTDQL